MAQFTILECERLRGEAQKARVTAIRTSIATAFTFCHVGENERQWHSQARAFASLERIRQFIRNLQQRIDDPHHLTRGAAIELQHALEELKTRADEASQFVGSRPGLPT
jgi:hypothetical protein